MTHKTTLAIKAAMRPAFEMWWFIRNMIWISIQRKLQKKSLFNLNRSVIKLRMFSSLHLQKSFPPGGRMTRTKQKNLTIGAKTDWRIMAVVLITFLWLCLGVLTLLISLKWQSEAELFGKLADRTVVYLFILSNIMLFFAVWYTKR